MRKVIYFLLPFFCIIMVLVMANEPKPQPVPDVRGLSMWEAQDALIKAGFIPEIVINKNVDSSHDPTDLVVYAQRENFQYIHEKVWLLVNCSDCEEGL